MRSRISEKSLEMNVNENIVVAIRRWGGVFSRAFIYGFTLRAEARHGFDSSINLPGTASFLFALQYKKPISKSGNIYRFLINSDKRRQQHILLWISSLRYRNVWYAFPLIIDSLELSRSSPNFLQRTCFVRVQDFPPHTFDRNKHLVEIDTNRFIGRVFSSEEEKLPIYTGENFLKTIKELTPIYVGEIERLSWDYVYEKMRAIGVKEELLEEMRREEERQYHRFTSGFFSM